MNNEEDIQEATWKRDAGVPDSNVEEEEESNPSSEPGAAVRLTPFSNCVTAHPNPHLE